MTKDNMLVCYISADIIPTNAKCIRCGEKIKDRGAWQWSRLFPEKSEYVCVTCSSSRGRAKKLFKEKKNMMEVKSENIRELMFWVWPNAVVPLDPMNSLDCCAKIERELQMKGLSKKYLKALNITPDPYGGLYTKTDIDDLLFNLLPERRVRAMLKVMEEEKKNCPLCGGGNVEHGNSSHRFGCRDCYHLWG